MINLVSQLLISVRITRIGYPCFIGFKEYASTGLNIGYIESCIIYLSEEERKKILYKKEALLSRALTCHK